MIYSKEVEEMCPVAQGVAHGCAPIPEEAKWVKSKEVKDISGLTHGVGWCAPQQGACKLTLNVKEGIIQEALVETIGCSGMTHSAAMAAEILPGYERTVLTDRLRKNTECVLRRRTSHWRRPGRPWKRIKKPGWYYVWYPEKRPSLSGNGRRLCNRHRS